MNLDEFTKKELFAYNVYCEYKNITGYEKGFRSFLVKENIDINKIKEAEKIVIEKGLEKVDKCILVEGETHYAKYVDKDGNFIKWVSNPNTKSYAFECNVLIEYCEKTNNCDFVKRMRKWFDTKGFLTKKQFDVLEKIYKESNEK